MARSTVEPRLKAKRLGKFARYIEHLDPTDCTTVIAVMLSVCVCVCLFVVVVVVFLAVNMHLSACWECFFFFFHSKCV